MKYRNLAWMTGVVVMLLTLSGCDWLGMVAGFQPDTNALPAITELAAGDHWTYSETETVTRGDETTVYSIEFTQTATAETIKDLAGQTAWVLTREETITREGEELGTSTNKAYYSQGDNNRVYYHGNYEEENGDQAGYASLILAEDGGKVCMEPYPLVVGAVHTWEVGYNDGTSEKGSSTVIAIEEVTVSAGTFRVAKVESQLEYKSDHHTATCTATSWYAPEVGGEAKASYECTGKYGERTVEWTAEYELTDSNLVGSNR